jgi:hypothetical protein
MTVKSCSNCSESAHYSLVFVLSSVGASPRVQKCSPAVALCKWCLQELGETECLPSDELRKAVNSAYTAINQLAGEQQIS